MSMEKNESSEFSNKEIEALYRKGDYKTLSFEDIGRLNQINSDIGLEDLRNFSLKKQAEFAKRTIEEIPEIQEFLKDISVKIENFLLNNMPTEKDVLEKVLNISDIIVEKIQRLDIDLESIIDKDGNGVGVIKRFVLSLSSRAENFENISKQVLSA